MPCRCIQTSAEVREIVLRNKSFLLSCVTEWNSGDRNQVIVWSATSNADVIFHSVRLQASAVFTEIIDQAEWGTLYYAMQTVSDNNLSFSHSPFIVQGSNVTYKAAGAENSRGLFARDGALDNQGDSNFRAISSNFEVFAISRDFGSIQATQTPAVWTVGYTTDPAVNYTDLSGAAPMPRSLYYKSQYLNNDEALASIVSISCGMICLTF